MFEPGHDQASGLRRMVAPETAAAGAPRALALMAFALDEGASPRWIAPLAHGLCALGARPVVIDAGPDAALSQAFGVDPQLDLLDYLHGAADFDAVAVRAGGVHVLRAERGLEAFALSGAPSRQLFGALARLDHGFDVALLAMPAHELASMADPGHAVPVLALAPGHEGLVRAYATLKQLAEGFGYQRFALVGQGGNGAQDARRCHGRLADTVRAFLNADVALAGALPAGGEPDAGLARLAGALLDAAATPCSLH